MRPYDLFFRTLDVAAADFDTQWGEGAIGTAKWTGVSLKKVIKACGGLKDGAQHLEFAGADTYFKKGHVDLSIPDHKPLANSPRR